MRDLIEKIHSIGMAQWKIDITDVEGGWVPLNTPNHAEIATFVLVMFGETKPDPAAVKRIETLNLLFENIDDLCCSYYMMIEYREALRRLVDQVKKDDLTQALINASLLLK
jgi:hypothetical protein